MNTTNPRRTAIIGIAAVVAGAVALPAIASANDDRTNPALELTLSQEKVIAEATRQFRNPEAAVAAGYIPTDECAELPGVGGMGFHYVNPAALATAGIDPTLPEILVYYTAANGKRRLGSIEYFAADGDQNLATDADRPTLFGKPFDGPMPGHGPDMPVHYDLHVWLYKRNPAGTLAAWNPNVSCGPSAAGHAAS